MPESADFLVELGTEELPPKTLNRLAAAFFDGLVSGLQHQQLSFNSEKARWFATPRRLALLIPGLALKQPDIDNQRQGPAVKAAFDSEGQATPAALGFARSCGVEVEQLSRVQTDKGERLTFSQLKEGQQSASLVLDIVSQSLRQLPIAKPMRWGDSQQTFVRPVHWVLMMLGDETISGELFGLPIGKHSRGHRFHAPEPLEVPHPDNYEQRLRKAFVVVDPAERQSAIREQATVCAKRLGGVALLSEALVEEVANLVEWPVSVTGHFDEAFLEVPQEALISSMESHQRFFPVVDAEGHLMPHFIGFANVASSDLEKVRSGYGRVIRPRLADARFFWDSDRKTRLAAHQTSLGKMVYQKRLGSLWDKCLRVRALAVAIAEELGENSIDVAQAAELAKCDLLTDMVAEFPDLQGVMGRYYALQQGESEAVALAIEQHYHPRFAGDLLPEHGVARVLGVADRLDSLCGIFSVGLKPTGNKDPFALRRAALGLVRILIECEIDLDLAQWVDRALKGLTPRIEEAEQSSEAVLTFIMDRLRAYYADQHISTEVFEAVLARRPTRVLDFHQRIQACHMFAAMEPAVALAAANKRIANILRKAGEQGDGSENEVNPELLVEAEEQALHQALTLANQEASPLIQARDYQGALLRLAELRPTVDAFFDAVMVMAEEDRLRNNRLTLLATVKGLFDQVADISRLVIDKKTK